MITGFVNQNDYMVNSVQVEVPASGRTERFYVPMIMSDLGFTWEPILNCEELPTHWGFETENEAWAVCKDHAKRQEIEDRISLAREELRYARDCEDFHADG